MPGTLPWRVATSRKGIQYGVLRLKSKTNSRRWASFLRSDPATNGLFLDPIVESLGSELRQCKDVVQRREVLQRLLRLQTELGHIIRNESSKI
jgi:hypothetical protein